MSKLKFLVIRWLFMSTNGINMQILGLVSFRRSTLTVYCLSSWFVHQELKTYSALCVLCQLGHLAWFQGLKCIPLVGLEWQIMMLSQKSWKSDFLGHYSFTQLFHDAEKLRIKPKTFVNVIQRFWYVKHIRLIFKKFHQKQPKFQPWKKFFNVENLGMLRFSTFRDLIFATTTSHTQPPLYPSARQPLSNPRPNKLATFQSWKP